MACSSVPEEEEEEEGIKEKEGELKRRKRGEGMLHVCIQCQEKREIRRLPNPFMALRNT